MPKNIEYAQKNLPIDKISYKSSSYERLDTLEDTVLLTANTDESTVSLGCVILSVGHIDLHLNPKEAYMLGQDLMTLAKQQQYRHKFWLEDSMICGV